MQIIVVRHASTLFNEQEIINGQTDESLSPKGFGQISGLIEKLADYEFSTVYCSPMKRSVQTAEPIAKHYDMLCANYLHCQPCQCQRFSAVNSVYQYAYRMGG